MHIREWQTKLGQIFPNGDMSPDYIMVHLSTKCSELSRIFNHQKHHFVTTDPYILKSISWLIALCNHFKIDLEKTLISRFPGKCSYCLRSPCQCSETLKKAFDLHTERELSQEEIEIELNFLKNSYFNAATRLTFDGFRDLIFRVYPANKLFVYSGFYSFPLGKLDEEKGELHKAYSSYLLGNGKIEEIAVEVADVAAWLISFWGVRNHRKSIDAELSSLFISGCPTCHGVTCSCPRYSITKSEEELIRDIVHGLRSIKTSGLAGFDDIDQVISISQEIRNVDNPSLRQQFFSTVGQLTKIAKQAPAATEGVAKTAKNIDLALEALRSLFG